MSPQTERDEVERHCLARVRAWHWPDGLRCPYCGGPRCNIHSRGGPGERPKYRCTTCLRTFNDLTGTPFAHSRLLLTQWFACAESLRQGHSTCAELARRLRVKVATAWRMRKILRQSLSEDDFERLFTEDDT